MRNALIAIAFIFLAFEIMEYLLIPSLTLAILDAVWVGRLFLFHHGSDFLGFHGVDVAISIAEAEGAVVAATHGKQALHREVEAAHQFLGEGRNFILLGIHCYCCHIV